MNKTDNPLSLFHPLIQKWFFEKVGTPTDIQQKAWPQISSGSHVLITSPTGTGKTLTAFLWAINRLVTGTLAGGHTRILYISPLKALNNDVRQNLLKPIREIREYFKNAEFEFPQINVLTRSGDTPADERRKMLRRPPEILITTPESLNILLSSKNSRTMLAKISTVIADEIHSVIDSKRGTHLITAIERLVPLCGEFQRIALSATVKPIETVADFVGGYTIQGDKDSYNYKKRQVSIIASSDTKKYDIRICYPDEISPESGIYKKNSTDFSRWPGLVQAFKKIIKKNKSTLLFANTRRLTEKITRLLNEEEDEPLAYSHHGSLSKEIRLAVEQKLKNGGLKGIVATNSLELGIDIGDLDTVVLVGTPFAVSSAIQRVGRSGHKVGDTSTGLIYPTHGHDFINAAVVARLIADRDIEPQIPVEAPLDVLAQIIISMTGVEKWDIDELYAFIRTGYPYNNLSKKQFDLVLEMLAGKYAGTKVRELRSRIYLDRIEKTVSAKEGMLRLIYFSGGTIPDRGYFDLRVQESHAKIGELDEEFVWERNVGETFTLGSQTWRIQNITHNDVEVVQVEAKPGIFPFWKAEEMDRKFHFSENIAGFLEYADANINSNNFKQELCEKYFMERAAADELISYLKNQMSATNAHLPHRHHVLIEHFDDPLNKSDNKQVILHTIWGGRVNRPFALALSSAWEEKHGYHLEVIVNNDCIMLMLPHEFNSSDIFSMINPENLEYYLRKKLERTGFFGARFRENSGRALLLPKSGFKKRMPLWLNRLRSKKLFDAIMEMDDFPIMLETWRTCMKDEFDIENTKQILNEIICGTISVSEAITHTASPFADDLIYKQTNTYMYADDTPGASSSSSLSSELLKEIISSSVLRPRISDELIKIFDDKLKRKATGYAPRSPDDLLEWTRDRLLIPENEWQDLLSAIQHDSGEDNFTDPIDGKISWIRMPGAAFSSICAVENLPRAASSLNLTLEMLSVRPVHSGPSSQSLNNNIEHVFKNTQFISDDDQDEDEKPTLQEFMAQWLSYYGPVAKDYISDVTGIKNPVLDDLLTTLADEQYIIIDRFRENSETEEICDTENLEILLRMARKARQPSFKALKQEYLTLFCAAFQGITIRENGGSMDELKNCLDRLFGFPAPASAWEEYILPARMQVYYASWLDSLMQTSGLTWFGCGNKRTGFAFYNDLELFLLNDNSTGEKNNDNNVQASDTQKDKITALFPDINGKYTFYDILRHTGIDSKSLAKRLWDLTWQGILTNDSYSALRMGILNDFEASEFHSEPASPRRSGFNRWTSTRPVSGNWYVIDREQDMDPVEKEEINKDRVRQLFKRYGILFRELVSNELQSMQWSRIFKTLRLMELSGEIMSGYFFENIPGIQFISHEAFRLLSHPADFNPMHEDAIYWMNAADPASLCGIKLEGLKFMLPSRLSTTYLVFHGAKLVLVSKRNHKILEFKVEPGNPYINKYLSFLKEILSRDFNPQKILTVNIINEEPALKSEYAASLTSFGFRKQYNGFELMKQY